MYPHRNKNTCILIFIIFFVCCPFFVEEGSAEKIDIKKGDECSVCGMYMERFSRTAAEVIMKDGERHLLCGVACLARIKADRPDDVAEEYVTCWITGERVSAADAFYDAGSSIVPDMIPNIIAFKELSEAQKFRDEKGGDVINISDVREITSPFGMTLPIRLIPAATPPRGVFALGFGHMLGYAGKTLQGSDEVDPYSIASNPAGPGKAPDSMLKYAMMLKAGYALHDDLFLMVSVPYLYRKMKGYMRTDSDVSQVEFSESGIGDVKLVARYRPFHDRYYRYHFGFNAGVDFPTGKFSEDRMIKGQHGLQLGREAFSFFLGSAFSFRYSDFWLHFTALYEFNEIENKYEFIFGDKFKSGMAFHWTPSYKTLVGFELDMADESQAEYNGEKSVPIMNTGSTRFFANIVCSQRLFTAMGGNINLQALVGTPLYQDVEGTQLGGTVHGSLAINYKARLFGEEQY